jgi:transcriptional regulator with XRE-family HTH domain
VWFNSQLLKSLRKELEWSQQELATQAHLSVRVIAKAEAGSPVSQITLEKLVRCLAKAGKAVSCEDFVADHLTQVCEYLQCYAKLGADAVEHCRPLFDPNLEVRLDSGAPRNPLIGSYRGIDEFDLLHRQLFSIFTRVEGTLGDPSQLRSLGQEVLAWGHESLRVPGMAPQPPCFMMLRFVLQGGKISRLDWFCDAGGLMSHFQPSASVFPRAEEAASTLSPHREKDDLPPLREHLRSDTPSQDHYPHINHVAD